MTDYVLDHGIGDLSLRSAAAAIGVSHSSLLRHFETKEALVDSVIDVLCEDVLELGTDDRPQNPARALEALWKDLRDPRQRRQFLVLFEVVATRARNERRAEVADALLDRLLDSIAQPLRSNGLTAAQATAAATLVLAAIRGLQLDLAVADDVHRTDRAMALLVEMLEATILTAN